MLWLVMSQHGMKKNLRKIFLHYLQTVKSGVGPAPTITWFDFKPIMLITTTWSNVHCNGALVIMVGASNASFCVFVCKCVCVLNKHVWLFSHLLMFVCLFVCMCMHVLSNKQALVNDWTIMHDLLMERGNFFSLWADVPLQLGVSSVVMRSVFFFPFPYIPPLPAPGLEAGWALAWA